VIRRDKYNMIVQHNIFDPSEPHDGGDSANRTGIMALCGSKQDQQLILKFIVEDGVCRHPYQDKWKDPKLTSRDQLVSYAAGLGTVSKYYAAMLFNFYGWFVNKDILMPDVQGHLRRCAGMKPTMIQNLFLLISILWSTKIRPKEEQNQIICMVIVAGGFYRDLYMKWHPDWRGNVREYFSNWRDQPEIAEALINKMEIG